MNIFEEVIILDGKQPEQVSINELVSRLTADLAKSEEGSMEARMTTALIDMMPGFIRAFERERRLFNEGRKARDKDALDKQLQVLTLPIVNMLVSVVVTIFPKDAHSRGALTAHIFDNLFRAVKLEVIEEYGHGRGH